MYTQRDPLLGVIVAITPFDHPMNQVAHKIAPAIETDNRMVFEAVGKSAALRAAPGRHPLQGGAAAADFQVVTGDPGEIADELLTHADVDMVTFTGGVAIGKRIAAGSAIGAWCWNWAATIP